MTALQRRTLDRMMIMDGELDRRGPQSLAWMREAPAVVRRVSSGSTVAAMAVLVVAAGLAAPVGAQEATSDKPGVIERGEEDGDGEGQQQQGDGEETDGGDETAGPDGADPQPGQNGDQAPDQQGRVITPDNANPNEKYNLPPNFNPDYKPKKTPDDVKVTIDFRQANLEEVVKFFSGAMNKNFIIANSIQANKTITIISPEDVTLREAYRAFLAALEMNGLTVVQMGDFLKIVQAKQAMSEPSRTYEEGEPIPDEARMVTAIIPVKNAEVDRIREIVGNFTSPAATIIPYQNSLIVSENASNLRRIRRLVERLDKGDAGEQVFVYKVRYADATKVSEKLKEIFNVQKGNQQGGGRNRNRNRNQGKGNAASSEEFTADVSQLIADKRTNQLIVVTNKRSFEKVKDMIELLDVPTEAGGGQVHVKNLEYANAEELASTLSNLVSAAQQAQQRGGGGRGGEGGGRQVGAILQGEVQVTAYKPNNSLVVVASPKDYVALEQVIDKLDRPRKQVYVEAVIMEIGMDTDRTLGLGFNSGLGQDFGGVIPDSAQESGAISDTQGLVVGQSNFPGLTALPGALSGTGGSIGMIGPLVEVPGAGISLPAFALLLQATQTDNSVNILSTPSILTMDNKEAEIVVGEQVPFATGVGGGLGGLGGLGSLGIGSQLGAGQQNTTRTQQQAQTATGVGTGTGTGIGAQTGAGGLGGALGALGGGLGLGTQIQYQDVGLTLRIKPQVNDSNYVRLEVDQEVSDLKGAGTDTLAPTTTRRNAKTVVLVKDQSTVVIGGLMRDVENKTVEKVPFLGDIPLVGVLFRKTSTITTKQNLVLMLTPYIIESESDLQDIYERKLKERRELLKLFGKRNLKYMKQVNYQKKSGLVDRIRGKVEGALQEKRAKEEARQQFKREGPKYRILGDDGGGSNGGATSPTEEGGQPNDTGDGASNGSESSGESSSEEGGASSPTSSGGRDQSGDDSN